MKKTRLTRRRGETRPLEITGPFGLVRFLNHHDNTTTRVVGPTGTTGTLEFGPTAPGPFGEVVGLIDESKVVFRYRPWGSVAPGRHAFEIRHEGTEYVLVSRGIRPVPQLETLDGTVLAGFGTRSGRACVSLTPEEAILVALIAGSGIAAATLPQSWLTRH